jgi:hypothetical protein
MLSHAPRKEGEFYKYGRGEETKVGGIEEEKGECRAESDRKKKHEPEKVVFNE